MNSGIPNMSFMFGYLQRSMHLLPKQGGNEPWTFCRDYYVEKDSLPAVDLNEYVLVYSSAPKSAAAVEK